MRLWRSENLKDGGYAVKAVKDKCSGACLEFAAFAQLDEDTNGKRVDATKPELHYFTLVHTSRVGGAESICNHLQYETENVRKQIAKM